MFKKLFKKEVLKLNSLEKKLKKKKNSYYKMTNKMNKIQLLLRIHLEKVNYQKSVSNLKLAKLKVP